MYMARAMVATNIPAIRPCLSTVQPSTNQGYRLREVRPRFAKPLRDLALPFGCVSIAHGRANLPFHISLAFEKSVKSKGKSL